MCLTNVFTLKQMALEDIVVYKVAYLRYKSTEYQAPYQNFTYVLGDVMESPLRNHRTKVYEGFHSFVYYDDALKEAENLGELWNNRAYYVMKSYIPKGSEYYSGDFNNVMSYASNKLVIVGRMMWYDVAKYRLWL